MGDYLISDSPLRRATDTWPRHIDRYKWNHNKVFAENTFFGVDIIYQIKNQVQVSMHSYNTRLLENMETASLMKFFELQNIVEHGEYITSTPIWAKIPETKEDGKRKLEGRHGSSHAQKKEKVLNN